MSKALQGERADAPVEQANNFKARLPQLLSMYDPHDIFNADEVGLFYEQARRRTFLEQGQDPAGGKVSKKRMTILLVAAMDGHLEPMVVINKSSSPKVLQENWQRFHKTSSMYPMAR